MKVLGTTLVLFLIITTSLVLYLHKEDEMFEKAPANTFSDSSTGELNLDSLPQPSQIKEKKLEHTPKNHEEETELEGEKKKELTKFTEYNEYLNEMEDTDYSNISKFHDLVIYCNSLPKGDKELAEWENKHAGQDDVNLEIMRDELYSCTGIKQYSYSELHNIYLIAREAGSKEASFALAKHTPYESEEKIELLGRSAALFNDAHTMLVTRAIEGSEFLTMEERYFWMKTYSEKEQFGQEFDSLVSDIEANLSNHNLELVQTMISEWEKGGSSEKESVVLNVKKIGN